MKKIMVWMFLIGAAVCYWATPPAYAPLVTVVEEEPAEEDESSTDSDVVDFSDVEDADSQPTWSPSFENQEPKQ